MGKGPGITERSHAFPILSHASGFVVLFFLALWVARIVLGLLLVVALLVEHFLPRSRHPRLEIAGALLTVVVLTYAITAALRRWPTESSPHPLAFIPSPQQLFPAIIFLIGLIG